MLPSYIQRQRNRNMIGGVDMGGYKAADYPRKASACEGQELGGPSPLGSAALGYILNIGQMVNNKPGIPGSNPSFLSPVV